MQAQQQAPQDARPTVGDTVTVVQRIAVAPGTLVEARGPTDSTLATLMGTPQVSREGDTVRIAYTMSVWAPGRHQLVIPGAVTVAGDGTIDTLPDATVALDVASVLPERAPVESLTPQAARPWIERASPSGWPFVVILLPLVLALALATWAWRRRRKPLPVAAPARSRPASHDRLERWIAAGEVSLALDHLLGTLPDDASTREWREAVEVVRFDPAARERLLQLVRQGMSRLPRETRAG